MKVGQTEGKRGADQFGRGEHQFEEEGRTVAESADA